ncbi:MAG: hypothetical protein B7Y91_01180, partial [Rhodobacterales bacterium 32-64-14]
MRFGLRITRCPSRAASSFSHSQPITQTFSAFRGGALWIAEATCDPFGVGCVSSHAIGPNQVGVLTLNLSDRKVEVYYPAAAGAAQGRTNDVYLQTEPVPPMLAGMLKRIPETVDLKVTIPAFRDAPAAHGSSYPLVIFSHGAGGWRSGHGNLLSGIASWGFVVASVDFTEYGFASFASPGARDMNARRTASAAALDAALNLMEKANAEGPLKGLIDTSSIGAVGHSAGGGTMFAAIDNPRIDTVVGWAPVPPQ